MDPASKGRVQLLHEWCASHPSLQGDDGRPSIQALAKATGRLPQYWSDILRDAKTFGAIAARATEKSLGMPALHLEGAASWPFEAVDRARFDALSERAKGRLEAAMLRELDAIEAKGRG